MKTEQNKMKLCVPSSMDNGLLDLPICVSVNEEINSPQGAHLLEKIGTNRIIFDNFLKGSD